MKSNMRQTSLGKPLCLRFADRHMAMFLCPDVSGFYRTLYLLITFAKVSLLIPVHIYVKLYPIKTRTLNL